MHVLVLTEFDAVSQNVAVTWKGNAHFGVSPLQRKSRYTSTIYRVPYNLLQRLHEIYTLSGREGQALSRVYISNDGRMLSSLDTLVGLGGTACRSTFRTDLGGPICHFEIYL